MKPLLSTLRALWGFIRSRRMLHLLGTLLVVLIFSWAVYLLYYELTHVESRVAEEVQAGMGQQIGCRCQAEKSLHLVYDFIRQTPRSGIYWAVGLTLLSYLILVGYDLLAIVFVGQRLPLWKVALASFTGYAFSYNFGATLTGGPIRFRLYAGWKMPMLKVVELILILGLTFWFGLFFLAGVLYIISPLRVPQDVLAKLYDAGGLASFVAQNLDTSFRLVGVALLVIAGLYLGASALFRGRVRLWRWEIPVPPLWLTVYQYAIATADFVVAAGVLFVLLPPSENADFAYVMAVYILAYVAEVLTHVPGGWGVFDYFICKLLPGDFLHNFAAVLLFRLIYRLVPVLIAAVLLAINEVALRRGELAQLGRWMGRHREDEEMANDETRMTKEGRNPKSE